MTTIAKNENQPAYPAVEKTPLARSEQHGQLMPRAIAHFGESPPLGG